VQDDDNVEIGEDSDSKLLKEAKQRFKRCDLWEAIARKRWLEDYKFYNADSYNMYQWPDNARNARGFGTGDERPCLTVNKSAKHCDMIINDALQNKTQIRIKPVGNEATFEASEILEGVVRHIEYISDAQSHYAHAFKHQVISGYGVLRVVTDYCDDDTFDQEMKIVSVPDPLSAYIDPDATEPDASDARFAFIFTDMPRDEFDIQYPEYIDRCLHTALGNDEGWIAEKHVRIAEYFYIDEERDTLIVFKNPITGEQTPIFKSETASWKGDLRKALREQLDDPSTKTRELVRKKVKWCKIIGDDIADKADWAGSTIPVVPVFGHKTVIEGEMDRKGHIRSMVDSQRMINYNALLDLKTPVPTPTGWTTIGEVRPGDYLLDENGKPAKVLGLSPIHINKDCYRVTFDDGTSVVTDADHKWTVEDRGKRKTAGMIWSKKDISTKEMIPGKHYIYVTEGFDLPEKELPLDPYTLGAWLGDGTTLAGVITSGHEDVQDMSNILRNCGHNVKISSYNHANSIRIEGLTSKLREAGVFGNKHIPDLYLRASYSQRLALLQGLMDTDGCIHKTTNQCVFSNTNQIIIDDIVELIRSLGLKVKLNYIAASLRKFPGGNISECLPNTQVIFNPISSIQVFRLERKRKVQQRERNFNPRRTKRHHIVSVVPVESRPVRCLGVDTPNHLFLVGEGMVPTHNSAAIEYGALQSKTPWIASAAAIEGQDAWASANLVNYSVLVWNHMDDDGNPLEAPARPLPPTGAPLYQEGMKNAADDMMMVSGQYQPIMGQPGNERSGTAIQARQRQGENATYHFIENQARAIRRLGKIIIDLIPKIYDTPRIINIMAEDGTSEIVQLDPDAKQAFMKHKAQLSSEADQIVLNPKVGKYEVVSDVGPDYATRRQEAFNALSQIASTAPELMSIIGDLVLLAADFPMAEQAAERLKRMVPPQALGETNGQVQQLQEQLQASQALAASMSTKLVELQTKVRDKDSQKEVDVYKAITDRIDVLLKTNPSKKDILQWQHDLAMQEHQGQIAMAAKALDNSLQDDASYSDNA